MKNLFSYVIDKVFSLENKKLSNSKTPEELLESFDFKLEDSKYTADPKDLIDKIILESINTQNPRFLNQLYGGATKEAWLGELLVSALNTSMATYEIAPLATLMEKEIIKSLNETLGFEKIEGLMAPGGSYANMLAVQCARYAKNPESKDTGMYKEKEMKIFVSKSAHYSFEKALGLMGMGTSSLVKVDVDSNKKMSMESLEAEIKKCISNGDQPICVVSTAGTTVWGSFDPILETNEICEKYGVWHHVDAAWGGLALWSDQKETLFEGVEKVDSITIDFHKLMASTLTKGIFLTSKPGVLKGANSGGGTKYIFHNTDDDGFSYDTGTYAIQCGRKVDSLPIWLQWKLGGTAQFSEKVSSLYELSSWTVNHLKEQPQKYKLLLSPEYMNICFQILPEDSKIDVGEFNKKIRSRLMERGNFMVNFSSTDKDGVFFRLVLSHWGLKQSILEELFEELDGIKKEFS